MNKILFVVFGVLMMSLSFVIAQGFPDDINDVPSVPEKNNGIKWHDVEKVPQDVPNSLETPENKDVYKAPENPSPQPQQSGSGGGSSYIYRPSKAEILECNARVYDGVAPLIYTYLEFKNTGVNVNPFGFLMAMDIIYSSENIKCAKYTHGLIDIIKAAI